MGEEIVLQASPQTQTDYAVTILPYRLYMEIGHQLSDAFYLLTIHKLETVSRAYCCLVSSGYSYDCYMTNLERTSCQPDKTQEGSKHERMCQNFHGSVSSL